MLRLHGESNTCNSSHFKDIHEFTFQSNRSLCSMVADVNKVIYMS